MRRPADLGAFANQFLVVDQAFEDRAPELTPARNNISSQQLRDRRAVTIGMGGMEPRHLRQQGVAALPPLCGIVSTATEASEPDAPPEGLDLVRPNVPGQREPVEIDTIGGYRQQGRQCAPGIGLIERGQHRGTFRPPPPAERREGVKYGSPGQGLLSACMTQDEGVLRQQHGPARRGQFARRVGWHRGTGAPGDREYRPRHGKRECARRPSARPLRRA